MRTVSWRRPSASALGHSAVGKSDGASAPVRGTPSDGHARRPLVSYVLGALALAIACGDAEAQAPAPLKIGVSAPLTGPDAAYGQGVRAGAEQAVADLNRAGGVAGRTLVLVVADDAGDGRQGMTVMRRFAAERVGLVIGPVTPSVAALAVPAYEAAGIVAITPGTSWTPLTTRGLWNVFRLCGSDAEQGRLAGAYLAQAHRGRRIGLVHDKTAFGRGLVDEVSRMLKAAGQAEAAFEGFDHGERDLSRLAGRLARQRVEVVYVGGLAGDAATLIRALRAAGSTAPLVASDGLVDRDFVTAAGADAEGTVITAAPEPRWLPDARAPNPRPARPPEAEDIAAKAYAAVEVLARAVEQAKSAEGRAVAEFLHSGRPVGTLIGEVAFDAKGDLRRGAYALQAWRKTSDGRIDYLGNPVGP